MRVPISKLLLAVLTLVATVGITVVVTDDGHGGKTRTVHVGPTAAQLEAAPPTGELQSDTQDVQALRDSTPEGVSPARLQDAEENAGAAARQLGVPPADKPLPVAGAQGYSCRQSYASRGYGAARSYFLQFVLHYTVSPNATGWADVYNIKRYLESVGLSATFIMDFEGHCLQTVPLGRNPYTQGSMNQYSASVEIIATGKESRAEWLAAPIFKKGILAALARDQLLSHKLPIRFVDPVGCTPKAGYTDHDHLECGNNHVDVSPNFPWDVFNRQVRQAPAGACDERCKRVAYIRGKHRRTHRRFVKNECSRRGPRGHVRHGYCDLLRLRNARMHRASKAEHISLRGTYR